MTENTRPFSIGSVAVILETEEIVKVTGFEPFKGEEIVTFVDEYGEHSWGYRDEFEDFHSWMMNEIEFDF